MLERELKLYLPPAQQAAVIAAVQQLPAQQHLHLAAHYFDTPQRSLAQQGAALRLRLENEQWVQTLKMRGSDALSNMEYNHLRPDASLDLSLYEHTAAATLFSQLNSPLQMRYQTDVQRTTALITSPTAEIELALDIGVIQALDQSIAISEIEFELKKGEMAEVFSTALDWLQQFHLLFELRSKAERGDTLYEGRLDQASALSLQSPHHPDIKETYTTSASTFLHQVIRNATLLAGIDRPQASEKAQARYLMLLRVGLRRLRSCRQLFKPWLTASEQQLAQQLNAYHKQFGTRRDSDMIWLELQPKLERAGLPEPQALPLPQQVESEAGTPPQALAASLGFQRLLVQSLANLILDKAIEIPNSEQQIAQQQLQSRLEKWLQRIQRQSEKFDTLSASAQHDLRNRIKRLRYTLEIFGYNKDYPLYAALAKAQDQLGDLCDAYVACAWYEEHAVNATQKQFALNWLADTTTKKQEKSKRALQRLQGQHVAPLF